MKKFLKSGIVMCIAGGILIFYGFLSADLRGQIIGILIYACSLPLLFEYRVVKLEKSIEEIKEKLKSL